MSFYKPSLLIWLSFFVAFPRQIILLFLWIIKISLLQHPLEGFLWSVLDRNGCSSGRMHRITQRNRLTSVHIIYAWACRMSRHTLILLMMTSNYCAILSHHQGLFTRLIQLVNWTDIHVELAVSALGIWDNSHWLVVSMSRCPLILIGAFNFDSPLMFLWFQMLLILRVLLLSDGRAWSDLLVVRCRAKIDLLLGVGYLQLLRLVRINHWLIAVFGIFGARTRILGETSLETSRVGPTHIKATFEVKRVNRHAILHFLFAVGELVMTRLVHDCWRICGTALRKHTLSILTVLVVGNSQTSTMRLSKRAIWGIARLLQSFDISSLLHLVCRSSHIPKHIMLINIHTHNLASILVPNIDRIICIGLILARICRVEPTRWILGVLYGQCRILVAPLPRRHFGSIHRSTRLLAFNLIGSRVLLLAICCCIWASIVDNVYLVSHDDRGVSVVLVTGLHLLTLVVRMVLRGASDRDSPWWIHQTSWCMRLYVRIPILGLPARLIALDRLTSHLFAHR